MERTRNRRIQLMNLLILDDNVTEIILVQIRNSNNYYDEKGYLYTKNNTRMSQNSYFRCKHFVREKCKARIVSRNNNLSDCVLRCEHNHLPTKKDLTRKNLIKRWLTC